MDRFIKDKHGITRRIGLYCHIEDGKVIVYVDSVAHSLKAYYRAERTLDDHMGNTPCGYFVNVPLTKNETKRVYLQQ